MHATHVRTCPLCEATCGILVEMRDEHVVSIRGDAEDPFSQGYICPKAAALKDLHEDPDRLRVPQRRTASGWTAIGWDEAFDEVAAALRRIQREHGRDSIGVYQGNPTVHSLGLLTFGQLLLRRLGTRNMYSATSADQLPHMLASLLMFGHQGLLPVPDVDRTSFLLMLGANPLVSNGSVMTAPGIKRRLQALRARGGRLVVVDPRRTKTSRIADQHLFIRPGTDALLLLAILHTLFAEGLVALGRLAAFTDGLEHIEAIAARYAPNAVAAAVGVEAEIIRQLAKDFATAPSAVCYGRVGVSTQEFGGLCGWLVNVLNIVSGNFDQPGGAMFTTPAIDLIGMAASSRFVGSFGRYRSRAANLPEFGGELPVAALAAEIEEPGPRQIRALITSAGNPVLSIPNGARLESALAGLDFMVSIDMYRNETTRHANIILPPTSPLQRSHYDLAFNLVSVRNHAKWVDELGTRAPDERHDWEICLELASRMGNTLERPMLALLRAAGKRLGPAAMIDLGLRVGPWRSRGLSLATLRKQPHGIDLGPLEPRLPERLFTRDNRIELAPEAFIEDLKRLDSWLAHADAEPALRLIGRRDLRSNNSWMHNSRRLMKGKPRCTLLMHPEDAAVRGIGEGDTVSVRSRVGELHVAAELTDDVMQGVVSLPHGWGHDREGVSLSVAAAHAGVSLNDITDEEFVDRLSGNASFSGVPVEVARSTSSSSASRANS